MTVWVMTEATCEVAVVCHDAASIHINARWLCTCTMVMHLLASAFHLLSSVIVYLQYMRDASTGGAEMADSIEGRVSEGRGRRHHKTCFLNATHRSSHVSWRYVLRGGREGRERGRVGEGGREGAKGRDGRERREGGKEGGRGGKEGEMDGEKLP